MQVCLRPSITANVRDALHKHLSSISIPPSPLALPSSLPSLPTAAPTAPTACASATRRTPPVAALGRTESQKVRFLLPPSQRFEARGWTGLRSLTVS
ncbi:hypothetical protein QQF64_026787 [Cirrhinus molitorella]|uniref:Uncharacterized protein n=1 Tax=Cirrhinus molitorella TaxID=172907 RepID=A0ABR3NAJ3_9TELE